MVIVCACRLETALDDEYRIVFCRTAVWSLDTYRFR
jgi:hypothetical protein